MEKLDLQSHQIYENYCREIKRIMEKLGNVDIPEAKKERIQFRLRDIKTRLVPQLISRMTVP